MAENFFRLSSPERQDALGVAAERSGRPAHLLEKDIWVVWALRTMFESEFGPNLVFKGGTSLSKAYGAIHRFSEDVDLTFDIRKVAPDLVGAADNGMEPLPPSKSQERKWTKEIRARLAKWIGDGALPLIGQELERGGLPARAARAPDEEHAVWIEYEPSSDGYGYVRPAVVLEFGARSTGEPCQPVAVRCDAAEHLPTLSFPESTPRVMRVERTFWEKATAIHVFCQGGKLRGSRFSRHWYDLAQLDKTGHSASALQLKELALQVAQHKKMFFLEKVAGGDEVDYVDAVSGNLQLVPNGPLVAVLAEDYRKMVEDGLLMEPVVTFEDVMAACSQLQQRLNAAMKVD